MRHTLIPCRAEKRPYRAFRRMQNGWNHAAEGAGIKPPAFPPYARYRADRLSLADGLTPRF